MFVYKGEYVVAEWRIPGDRIIMYKNLISCLQFSLGIKRRG